MQLQGDASSFFSVPINRHWRLDPTTVELIFVQFYATAPRTGISRSARIFSRF